MRTYTCDELEEIASELALDLVTGPERAMALAHLEHCHACRRLVGTLAETADAVLLLSPPTEPPAGFDRRVLTGVAEQTTPAPTPAPARARRPVRRAGLVLAAIAALVVGLLAVNGIDRGGQPVAAAEMRAAGNTIVGHAYVHHDDTNWVLLDMPAWAELVQSYGPAAGRYSVAIDRRDGSQQVLDLPTDEPAPWRLSIDAPASDIAGLSILDDQGRVWCHAQF
jgi:hypothetical protein